MVVAKRLRSGKWRLYQIEQQALLAWRGPNYSSEVVRDLGGDIVNFASLEEAQAWGKENLNDALIYEAPRCEVCDRYLGLAEDKHTSPRYHDPEVRARLGIK